ncbi:hypothetical protein EVAR_57372_1 [Eumeta japonica]|uniref:Uncharacterized protein n=1 Tax=Eumeta variegata TaxID=151549 RepID=A0A4C1ZBU9_EUMVA|nr:hypothetical protein EVAR_57372_1 [Eumeta japonica]
MHHSTNFSVRRERIYRGAGGADVTGAGAAGRGTVTPELEESGRPSARPLLAQIVGGHRHLRNDHVSAQPRWSDRDVAGLSSGSAVVAGEMGHRNSHSLDETLQRKLLLKFVFSFPIDGRRWRTPGECKLIARSLPPRAPPGHQRRASDPTPLFCIISYRTGCNNICDVYYQNQDLVLGSCHG